ncbi:unnamed protein product [Brassicogethes aeneus]|uniref:C2H2-type domain-containing protein n=1 Tax=Brassicogethes aeneus TaxID=1431903 RepID=A0A9P0B571_BRAAE|nr:unnamed protein product [Brassicogethes aeneus]
MSVPSMVHRSGDSLIVRSVVSGDALFGSADGVAEDELNCSIGESDSVDEASKDLPDCKVKRNYSCTHCTFFTQNPRSFLYHLRDVHDEKVKIYECPNCLYASKHYQKLLRHTKMVHGGTQGLEAGDTTRKSRKRSSTAAAPVTAEDEDAMDSQDDQDDYQRPAVFKCSLCPFTSKIQSQLSRHEREEHIKTKFFRCTKCNYVTHIKARFTKHVKYHSMPMIKCDMCDFRTPYKWNLDRHCKNHNGRGAFRCSACNFTADIKQSLTVHEMNHHVPPVGQAVGLGVGRRRNKVGASDATAAEEAAQQNMLQVSKKEPAESATTSPSPAESETNAKKSSKSHAAKRAKTSSSLLETKNFGSDFVHPDDIVSHSNGKVYIKNKCVLCNFKTAWEAEMIRHEKKVHNIGREEPNKPAKKVPRPIPELIPIPTPTSGFKLGHHRMAQQPPLQIAEIPELKEPEMSQKDINDICAKSGNSALKDFASLFNSEEMFKDTKAVTSQVPDLIPTTLYSSTPKSNNKKTSFFDRLQQKLLVGRGASNLICSLCGHESTCLSQQVKHQKTCGKESKKIPNIVPVHNISSSRCQFCRQRCKSSTDLYNHLSSCIVYQKTLSRHTPDEDTVDDSSEQGELRIDEDRLEESEGKPHPMENKVFIWNDIQVPMDIEVDDSNYEYTDDKCDDNISIDLSIRTQSPGGGSEVSFPGQDYIQTNNNNNNNHNNNGVQHSPVTTDKIPTHGNDITIAQHKRVFKCPHCTFWASTASRFHVHIVGHLNKKPFECSLCAYRSNWRWDITKHIKLKSVRDRAHESAKVLMTDETGRRNYTKYNKYLTEIPVSGEQSLDTSGGSGTRPKSHQERNSSPSTSRSKSGHTDYFSPAKQPPRPMPPLKAANGSYLAKISDKKRRSSESKRTQFKCKRCDFRDASKDVLLEHVKSHYQQAGHHQQQVSAVSGGVGNASDTTLRGTSPDRDERHCRLKHSGDIRVVSNKDGQEKLEMEEQTDEPDHVDVPQFGTFKCSSCPFSSNHESEFEQHLIGHAPKLNAFKCQYCKYYVYEKEDLSGHLRYHGISDPDEFLSKLTDRTSLDGDLKRFKCLLCPYVTNSKSQYTYHKQFHKARGGQYTCTYCTYNVSKRHLLHQHLKIHGINVSPQKQNGESLDITDISDEIEEVPQNQSIETQNFPDIPLVWVSKNGKFSKMFKCRYCPHVNLRKVNIQEHEKMHSIREKNPNATRLNDVEHRCTECNYVCNNAGVLSSHSKVHQGTYGTIHKVVDFTRSDEEQIKELSKNESTSVAHNLEFNFDIEMEEPVTNTSGSILYFCKECPARFLKENEFAIHKRFHSCKSTYVCDYCTFSAKQNEIVQQHQQIHFLDYQERTKNLQSMYTSSINYPQPQTYSVRNSKNEDVWMVYENNNKSSDVGLDTLSRLLSKPPRASSQNVPLSGTELFQQKTEVIAQMTKDRSPTPQFHGNPDFIYPTSTKNGKSKEKRYKCPKCPSAFDKREQFKTHAGLHGSNQKYNCEYCDYSVQYYTNYAQHKKKHMAEIYAKEAAKANEEEEEEDILEVKTEVEDGDQDDEEEPLKLCVNDKIQSSQGPGQSSSPTEDRKLQWCLHCPYSNLRKDALENHMKRHVGVSGITSTYTCDHCDYSVPQSHYLRDHTKIHFLPNKVNQVEGYLSCDDMKLTAEKGENAEKCLLFEEKGSNQFLPALPADVSERFNNNEGEKQLINLKTGEIVDRKNDSDTLSSPRNEDCDSEVISQTSSDN